MKKRLLNLYIFFVTILFIFALGVFGFNIFSEYSHGENRCNRRFEHLTATLKQDFSNNIGFTSENIAKAVGSLEDFSYIVISAENKIVYAYPSGTFETENQSSKLVKVYIKTINTNSGNFSINAGIYKLRPTEIGKYAKLSFLIILIATIITILIIIVISATDNKNSLEIVDDDFEENSEKTVDQVLSENPLSFTVNSVSNKEPSLDSNDISDSQSSDVTNNNSNINMADSVNTISEGNTKDIVLQEPPIEEKTSTYNDENEIIKADFPIQNKPEVSNLDSTDSLENTNPVVLPVEEVKPMELDNENPKGLFSPITGIGWESYLLTRLDNELNRAISSEIDLALFVIKLPGIQRDFSVMKDICDYLVIQFQFKDLIFEYKDDSIVAIKISSNIDDALSLAERINEDINNMLSDYPSKCFIGISTRTIRMMSAERLLKEADEALIHAQEDEDSPIIAFRADAIKYQKFLEATL